MSRKTADVLRAAKALIDTPDKWSGQVPFARGRLSSLGAIRQASDGDSRAYMRAKEAINNHMWRGVTTHAAVMALFDRAIAAEES